MYSTEGGTALNVGPMPENDREIFDRRGPALELLESRVEDLETRTRP